MAGFDSSGAVLGKKEFARPKLDKMLYGRLEVAATLRHANQGRRGRVSVKDFFVDLLTDEATAKETWKLANSPGLTEVGKHPRLRGRLRD